MKLTGCICFLLVLACQSKPEWSSSQKNFIERVVDFSISNKDNQIIELPGLDDSLFHELPEQSTLLLGKALTKRGFTEIESGRGNFPPRGPRIVIKVFKKDSCYCEVSKVYYFTTIDNTFETAERIRCLSEMDYLNASRKSSPLPL